MGLENVKRVEINNNYLQPSMVTIPLQAETFASVNAFQDSIQTVYENMQKQFENLAMLRQVSFSSIFATNESPAQPQEVQNTTIVPNSPVSTTSKTKNKPAANLQDDGTFNKLMEYVFKDEGGYVNHAKDPGGATNMGICKKWYDKVMGKTTLEEFKNLSKEDAKAYYYKEYWIPSGAKRLADSGNEKLAYAVFDAAIHHGVGTAKRLLKKSNGNAELMTDNRLAYMKGLNTWKDYSNGFQARIDKVEDRLSYMA